MRENYKKQKKYFRDSSKKYSKISLKKRVTLIEEVCKNDKNIYQTSKTLKIKYSTAKAIVLRFKKAGQVLIYKKSPLQMIKYHQKNQKSKNFKNNSIQGKKKFKALFANTQEKKQQNQIQKLDSSFLVNCWFQHFLQWVFCNFYNFDNFFENQKEINLI